MKRIYKSTLLALILSFTTLQATETIYENAEDGDIAGWRIYDDNPAGATINNILDAEKNSQVIQLQGSGIDNGFSLGNFSDQADAWNNRTEKILTLDAKFSGTYMFFVIVETDNGRKFMYYSSQNSDRGSIGGGAYIHLGLGTTHTNNQWYTERRDLQADLNLYEPNTTITAVDGIMIRGNGSVDNIKLSNDQIVIGEITYEDGEDGNTNGWSIYDNTPAGASIENVNGHIVLNGTNTQNGYMIGNWQGRANAWNDRDRKYLKWDMNFNEWSMIFVNIETAQGHRFLYYTPRSSDRGRINDEYIHHGLGNRAQDGSWHTFTRNLEADLQEFDPGNTLVSVNGILIRGSGQFDNIQMSPNAFVVVQPPLPPTIYEDFESGNMDKWTMFNGSQYSGSFVGSNIGSQNTYKLPMENDEQFFLSVDIYAGAIISHGMMGLRIDTDQGPRLIYWDAYRNYEHYHNRNNGTKPAIKYYGNYAIIALGNPFEGTQDANGLVHFKVDIDEQLQIFEPGNHVQKVWYYLHGNSNRIDNIQLSSN
jgi:hypothetical protein